MALAAPSALQAQVQDPDPPQIDWLYFAPATVDVRTEPQSITFTAHVTDPLSGLGFTCIYLGSPSGRNSVPTCLSADGLISGTINDGVYQATVTIPRWVEPGMWRLIGASIADVAGNYGSYTGEQLTAMVSPGYPTTLEVLSNEDITPIQIDSFTFNADAVDVRNGTQTFDFTMHITDDVSGVGFVNLYFSSPSGRSGAVGGLSPGELIEGTVNNGTFRGRVTVGRWVEPGMWHLLGASSSDIAGNQHPYSPEELVALLPSGHPTELEILSTEDSTPQQILTFSFSPAAVNIRNDPQTVTFRMRVVDDVSGIGFVNLYFGGPTGQSGAVGGIGPGSLVEGTVNDGVFEGTLTVYPWSELGTWHILGASSADLAGNHGPYTPEALIALLPAGHPTTLLVTLNESPTASAGADRTVIVGEAVTFDGSASSDPDGSIASYAWNFGDGATAAGVTSTHAFAAAGSYTVTLTVLDSLGATAIDTAVITVQTVSQAIQSLSGLVASFNLRQGISNSLDAKLENAMDAYQAANAGNRQDVVNKLMAFINAVEAQRGKELTSAQADQLIAEANRILSVL